MQRFYFILALAASYSLCISGDVRKDDCKKKERAACDFDKYPKIFPATVPELRGICRDMKELTDCILPIRETCSYNSDDSKFLRRLIDYIGNICREDSKIFQVISSNLECLHRVSVDIKWKCQIFSTSNSTQEVIRRSMRQYVEKVQREMTDDESSCLDNLWLRSCQYIKAGVKCGVDAGFAVKDILSHFYSDSRCTQDLITEITPTFNSIKLEFTQEEILQDLGERTEEPLETILRILNLYGLIHYL